MQREATEAKTIVTEGTRPYETSLQVGLSVPTNHTATSKTPVLEDTERR